MIGFQLAGENANEKNLITGTRYMNIEGMLPFENKVADYVRKTDNHVLYRVTPIFTGELTASFGLDNDTLATRKLASGQEIYLAEVQAFSVNSPPYRWFYI